MNLNIWRWLFSTLPERAETIDVRIDAERQRAQIARQQRDIEQELLKLTRDVYGVAHDEFNSH